MFITPSFKKSLIVEQFQGNYLNCCAKAKTPVANGIAIHVWALFLCDRNGGQKFK